MEIKKVRWPGRDIVLRGCMIVLMIVSYLLCLRCYKALSRVENTVTILPGNHAEEQMDGNRYDTIAQQEEERDIPTDFAMWREEGDTLVQAVNSGRTARIAAIKIHGKMWVLLGGFSSLEDEDREGCFLDQKAATELFGTADALGNQLSCGNKTYTVRGILEDAGGLVAMRPSADEITDTITIKTAEDTSAAVQSREFAARHGLTGAILNHIMLKETGQIFPLLLPLAVGIRMLLELRKTIKRGRLGPGWKCVCYGMMTLALLAMGATLVKFLEIPKDMIPTRWSDFRFWSDWLDNLKEQIVIYLRYPKGKPEIKSLWLFIRCAALGGMSLFFWGYSGEKKRDEVAY